MATQESTTTALIPVTPRKIGTEILPTANARDLHAFLGVTKEYATWVKTWLRKAHLVEHRDYEVFSSEGRNPKGGRPSLEHYLSMDAAKCIGMMSGTAKGDEVRAYFLTCERLLLERDTPSAPQTRGDILVQLAEAYRAQEERLLEVETAQREQALQLIEQQSLLITTQAAQLAQLQATQHANTKADLALTQQQWITLRQYVFVHDLARQLPPSLLNEYGRFLTGYCLEKNIPISREQIADRPYESENSYHMGTIEATLPGWRLRREGHISLIALPKAGGKKT